MLEQIANYLISISFVSGSLIIAIAFFKSDNQETEFEVKLWDKFQLKFRTKKSDINT